MNKQPDHERSGPMLKRLETKVDAEHAAFSASLQQLKRNSEQVLAFRAQMAKHRHDVYKAYIEAGFKPDQALELIKAEIAKNGY